MRKTKKVANISSSTLLILLFANVVFGCTYVNSYFSNINQNNDYLFIGSIVGYTEKRPFESSSFNTYGLKIEVTEAINLPEKTPNYYEVFLHDYCYSNNVDKKWLKKRYPINSKVRLFAGKTNNYKSRANSKEIRLEAFFWEITRNDKKKTYKSKANSIFNYSKWKKNEPFIDFELRKDLFRLVNTDALDEKIIILERLAYNRNILFVYQTAVENEIVDDKLRNKLFDIRKKAKLPLLPLLIDSPL